MVESSQVLTGDEQILPGATVRDFWAWALGDLKLNSVRGMLAQFLVARAVGDARRVDDGWGPFDVLAQSGVKIEVKSSAYVQSWYQARPSQIKFSGLITRRWDASTGTYATAKVVADVYVFAVNTCQTVETYDPLRVEDWDFYVMSGRIIGERGQKSMGLSTVRSLAGQPVGWDTLADSIEAAARLSGSQELG